MTTPSTTVAIIGTGFGGQAALRALQRAGVDDVVLLERRPFLGGTWKQNTYPGAAVDVQSPLYSLSGEPWDWSRMYAEQEELAAYTDHLIHTLGIRERTWLEANVTAVTWHAEDQCWDVEIEDGRRLRARFVVNASGPLSEPMIPDFPGRDTFAGPSWHTNTWRHDVELAGKRVAVVGSGASAAQVIPAIAPEVGHLHVFQRTPHWVLPRPDREFTGWQRALLRTRWAYTALRWAIYWGLETRVIGFKYSPRLLKSLAEEPALRHLREQVPDAALRAKLTPDYTIGCKRIILSNTLYPALGRSNVTLHDRSSAIAGITPTGLTTTDGQDLALDAIVYATGYRATEGVLPYTLTGRDGRTIEQAWASFPRAYLGTMVPGFPNLFLVTGPNTGIGHTSALFIIESQMRYLVRAVRRVLDGGVATVEPTVQAEDRYTTWIHDTMERTVWKQGGCQSWYQSADGHVIAMFPGFSFTFWRWCGRFSEADHRVEPWRA